VHELLLCESCISKVADLEAWSGPDVGCVVFSGLLVWLGSHAEHNQGFIVLQLIFVEDADWVFVFRVVVELDLVFLLFFDFVLVFVHLLDDGVSHRPFSFGSL